jgi:hypothetical protein
MPLPQLAIRTQAGTPIQKNATTPACHSRADTLASGKTV